VFVYFPVFYFILCYMCGCANLAGRGDGAGDTVGRHAQVDGLHATVPVGPVPLRQPQTDGNVYPGLPLDTKTKKKNFQVGPRQTPIHK
jgi:hypothetical protein